MFYIFIPVEQVGTAPLLKIKLNWELFSINASERILTNQSKAEVFMQL
jgi:hypothetical protein